MSRARSFVSVIGSLFGLLTIVGGLFTPLVVDAQEGLDLRITSTALPPAVVGDAYSATLTATGSGAPYRWSWVHVSGMSGATDGSGIQLAENGTLSGTPTRAGVSTVRVIARNTFGIQDARELTLTIRPPAGAPPETTTPSPASEPVQPTNETARPFRPIVPNPSVPIPGVTFTPASQEGEMISIPYLAQYISGIYRLSVGLGAVLAAVMIVFGGFKYMLAASAPEMTDGKTIIIDAVVGLVVLLTSFLILKTINPKLVEMNPIRIGRVTVIHESEQILNTTRGQTGGEEFASGTPLSSTACPFPDLPAGRIDCGQAGKPACTPEHCAAINRPAGCHDSAVVQAQDPRAHAFATRMGSRTSNPDPRQRVIEVANAAAACQVHLGSCGNTARTIRNIAGYTQGNRHLFESSDLVRQVREVRCERPTNCGAAPAGCTSDAGEARNRVRTLVRAQQDTRANMLQPGDYVWIYNANTHDCAGQHSVLFIGWEGNGPYARVVQGAWGHNVKTGRVCLKTSCPGGNFSPITRIQ